jgi:cytochrome c oxidase subunit 3
MAREHAEHFADFETQVHASQLAMWIFVGTEVLLFSGMFALYGAYRVRYGAGFAEGVDHNLKWDGSLNTLILLVSSYLVARAIPGVREGSRGQAMGLLVGAMMLGLVFLGLKGFEYSAHFAEGINPGRSGPFFVEHPTPGLGEFFTLYFLMTGAHAIHVIVGLAVLGALVLHIRRAQPVTIAAHRLEIGAMYWHLVDIVWIFLWPLFYLTGAHSP